MAYQFRFAAETRRCDVPEHERATFDAEQAIRGLQSMSKPTPTVVPTRAPPSKEDMDRLFDSIRSLR